jgi:microcystin-dependent protein
MAQPFVGQIMMVGFNFAPVGWAFCDGSFLAISQFDTLFNLIGTTYGGDGQQTFQLPDLRGRVPIHQGQGPGFGNYVIGERAGSESVTVTLNQFPAHTHNLTVNCSSGNGNASTPVGNIWSKNGGLQGILNSSNATNAMMRTDAVTLSQSTPSGNQPHDNMQPFNTVNFIIALEGIFPSQN